MGKPEQKVVCFQCGQPVLEDGPDGGPRLNVDEEGVPCGACSDRLLDQLPPIFHTPWKQEAVPEESLDDSYREEA